MWTQHFQLTFFQLMPFLSRTALVVCNNYVLHTISWFMSWAVDCYELLSKKAKHFVIFWKHTSFHFFFFFSRLLFTDWPRSRPTSLQFLLTPLCWELVKARGAVWLDHGLGRAGGSRWYFLIWAYYFLIWAYVCVYVLTYFAFFSIYAWSNARGSVDIFWAPLKIC